LNKATQGYPSGEFRYKLISLTYGQFTAVPSSYKAKGASAVDAEGNPDTVEWMNVSKDDALSYPKPARRTYPHTVNARMKSTITPFVQKSVDINDTILAIFNEKLGLPEGALDKLHTGSGEFSGCETRVIRNPAAGLAADRMAIGAHTDFGSLSFLHNRLGGLQVLPPGVEEWQHVKVSSIKSSRSYLPF